MYMCWTLAAFGNVKRHSWGKPRARELPQPTNSNMSTRAFQNYTMKFGQNKKRLPYGTIFRIFYDGVARWTWIRLRVPKIWTNRTPMNSLSIEISPAKEAQVLPTFRPNAHPPSCCWFFQKLRLLDHLHLFAINNHPDIGLAPENLAQCRFCSPWLLMLLSWTLVFYLWKSLGVSLYKGWSCWGHHVKWTMPKPQERV